MRIDAGHEAKTSSEGLLRAAAPYDDWQLGPLRRSRVTRTKLLSPARIVGVESTNRDELIARLNTSGGGGAPRNYLSHVQSTRVLKARDSKLRHVRGVVRQTKSR
jgi:hypothetical protein